MAGSSSYLCNFIVYSFVFNYVYIYYGFILVEFVGRYEKGGNDVGVVKIENRRVQWVVQIVVKNILILFLSCCKCINLYKVGKIG